MKKQMNIIVASSVAGKRRAGCVFTGVKEFGLRHFSAEQLKAIAADPDLGLAVGSLVAADEVDALVADIGKIEADAEGKSTKAAKAGA